ncbi:hypothetical protein [Pseudoclavibacter helvolus]|uniref:hypothetical protein n=1 Tax=Pseudoclavibacter helvolus TaxID=255205 RepID=UPI0035E6F95E
MNQILNRLASALPGEAPIYGRDHTRDERAHLVRRAELVIDKHFETDTQELVGDWFAARLQELEVAA